MIFMKYKSEYLLNPTLDVLNSSLRIDMVRLNRDFIYVCVCILSPVKPELGVIPSGQEIIHE